MTKKQAYKGLVASLVERESRELQSRMAAQRAARLEAAKNSIKSEISNQDTWSDDIVTVLEKRGGMAPLRDIYRDVTFLRQLNGKSSGNNLVDIEAQIRVILQQNYAGSSVRHKDKNLFNNPDLFCPVAGRAGWWKLNK